MKTTFRFVFYTNYSLCADVFRNLSEFWSSGNKTKIDATQNLVFLGKHLSCISNLKICSSFRH